MANYRTETIKAVKAMKITAEELGIKPNYQLIKGVKKLIEDCEIDKVDARDCIPEEFWEAVGINEEKYAIVEVEMKKMVYRTIKVAVLEEYADDESEIEDAIGDFDNLDYDDIDYSDEWVIDTFCTYKENLTKDEANKNYIYNDLD